MSAKKFSLVSKVETCEFIPATLLVPDSWSTWFWERISENAPFSWGDNNRTLVDMEDFLSHCESRFECAALSLRLQDETEKWLKKMRSALKEFGKDGMYVDLEN